MYSVQILMSTYNGEKYLKQQLESIKHQRGVDVSILVRDDGSSDKTLSILQKYSSKMKITILQGENLGFAKSFWTLVQHAGKHDFYAFCDQDDIWLSDKLQKATEMLETCNIGNEPLLYTSNAIAVDNSMNIINSRVFRFEGVQSLEGALKKSVLPGCVFVFNSALLEIARLYNGRIIAHDWLMYILAKSFGNVVYDHTAHIYYRIHEGNTIGISSPWIDFIGKIKRRFRKVPIRRSDICMDIITEYGNKLPQKTLNSINLFLDANSISGLIQLLKFKDYQDASFIIMALLKKI